MSQQHSGVNDPSALLSHEENELVFTIIGHRKQTKATAVVQMYHAHPDRNQWSKFKTGVVCLVKDNIKKTYYIRFVDINTKAIVYEQELYNQFTYKKDKAFFHSFPGDKFMVGLNFASEDEAGKFSAAVDAKVQERNVRKLTLKRRRDDGDPPHATVIGRPPVAPISDTNDPFSNAAKHGRPKRPKGKKITKSDIGLPSDFRHLAHVGFDPQTGAFDSNNISPDWAKLLDTVGVTHEQLKDQSTANFIYDFVEKHGGIKEANRQLEEASKKQLPPPPPSRRGPPPLPARGGTQGGPFGRRGPPPPPPRDSAPPPPPPSREAPTRGNIPAPPPPPPIGVPAPPPPPPVGVSGGPPPVSVSGGPPPPPPSSSKPTVSLPPVDNARNNLLSSIRAGVQLKAVAAEDESPMQDDQLEGMAGALARALAARSNAIQQSDESDPEEWEEEDDEWGSD